MDNDRRISGAQLFCVCLASSLLGLQMYAPYVSAGANAQWPLALLLTAIPIVLSLLLYAGAFRASGSHDLFELLSRALSPLGARLVMLLLGVYFIARTALTLGVHTSQIRLYLLEKTPMLVVLAVLLLTAAAIYHRGLRSLARTAELLMLLLALPLVIMLAAGLFQMDYGEVRVAAQPAWSGLPSQLAPAALTTGGAECAIFFLGTAKAKPKAARAMLPAFVTAFVIAAVYFFIAAGVLTVDGVALTSCPYIETARLINIGGVVLTERFDLLFILIRLVCVIIQVAVSLYCAGTALCAACGTEDVRRMMLITLPVAFVCSLSQTAGASIWWQLTIGGMVLILPVLSGICAISAGIIKRRTLAAGG